jgi:hypothetical protein
MSFPKRISPTNRILEKIELRELVEQYGMSIPLEFKNKELHGDKNLAIFAKVYVFSGDKLGDFVAEIVEKTYEETFALLKRKMREPEDE